MLGHLLLPEIEDMIRAKDFAGLREAMADLRPPDVGELIEELPEEDQAVIFRILPRQVAAQVFEYLAVEAQESLLKSLGREQVGEILNAMAPDDRTALLEELPAEATKRLLALLTPDELVVAKKLLGYPEDTIGRLMTPDYVAIKESWTVSQVLDHVRTHGRASETLNILYVIDEKGTLLDEIRSREFLLAPLDKKVSELMDRTFVSLKATDDQEKAVETFRKYDMTALPVTDSGGVLVGIVTVDDVFDVATEEATEDFQKIGGMAALEYPYLEAGFGEMLTKRAGWLVVLFLGEMLTATAMAYFEEELEKALVLALFVPLIISSGGNSGSQAATLVIRALSIGEVALRDWWRVMRRELVSGLTLGAILGLIGFLRVIIWSRFTDIYGTHAYGVGLTVGVTLVGVVMFGTLAGSMLPLVLKRVGVDPATASAPFIATLVDVTGLIIYFGSATIILKEMLQ
ncbi:MAG: magnesium transporter [bacterium]